MGQIVEANLSLVKNLFSITIIVGGIHLEEDIYDKEYSCTNIYNIIEIISAESL